MKRGIERLCLLLASSDFSESDLRQLLPSLRQVPPTELIAVVKRLRLVASRDAARLKARESLSDTGVDDLPSSVSGLASRVDRLLRGEARLSSSHAIMLLLDAMSKDIGTEKNIRPRARETLRQWVIRVSEFMPPSVILHYATALRNDIVHDTRSDWPLRTRD